MFLRAAFASKGIDTRVQEDWQGSAAGVQKAASRWDSSETDMSLL